MVDTKKIQREFLQRGSKKFKPNRRALVSTTEQDIDKLENRSEESTG